MVEQTETAKEEGSESSSESSESSIKDKLAADEAQLKWDLRRTIMQLIDAEGSPEAPELERKIEEDHRQTFLELFKIKAELDIEKVVTRTKDGRLTPPEWIDDPTKRPTPPDSDYEK